MKRSMEGDPHDAATSAEDADSPAARDAARRRRRCPTADVVVTNPTELAIAIKYNSGNDGARRKSMAKGADYMLRRSIRADCRFGARDTDRGEASRWHGRMYKTRGRSDRKCRRSDFTQAIAEILAYVYRLERQEDAAPASAECGLGAPLMDDSSGWVISRIRRARARRAGMAPV